MYIRVVTLSSINNIDIAKLLGTITILIILHVGIVAVFTNSNKPGPSPKDCKRAQVIKLLLCLLKIGALRAHFSFTNPPSWMSGYGPGYTPITEIVEFLTSNFRQESPVFLELKCRSVFSMEWTGRLEETFWIGPLTYSRPSVEASARKILPTMLGYNSFLRCLPTDISSCRPLEST